MPSDAREFTIVAKTDFLLKSKRTRLPPDQELDIPRPYHSVIQWFPLVKHSYSLQDDYMWLYLFVLRHFVCLDFDCNELFHSWMES